MCFQEVEKKNITNTLNEFLHKKKRYTSITYWRLSLCVFSSLAVRLHLNEFYFLQRFDLLTIKQIESTNQAINSYKRHNKLKHWHNVSNGLVWSNNIIVRWPWNEPKKNILIRFNSLFFSLSLYSFCLSLGIFSGLLHGVWMAFLRGTHTVSLLHVVNGPEECFFLCLSMLVKRIKWKWRARNVW